MGRRWTYGSREMALLTRSTVEIGIPERAEDRIADRVMYCTLMHVGAGSGTVPIGANNLASVLSELGRCAEARKLIGEALRDEPADSAARPLLEATALEAEICRSVAE